MAVAEAEEADLDYKTLSIRSEASGENVIAKRCGLARSFKDRFFGLMGKGDLSPNEGLYFEKCNSVHMWFMRISIDIIFVNKRLEITSVHEHVRPWKVLPITDFKASGVFELASGTAKNFGLKQGGSLCLS